MKKIIGIFSVLCVLAFAKTNAEECFASSPYYISAFGGANWLIFQDNRYVNIEHEIGFNGALALGYKINSCCRVEGEASYRINNLKRISYHIYNRHHYWHSGQTDSLSFMMNGYTDFHTNLCFTPYIGFGIGCSFARYSKHDSFNWDNSRFAGQAIVGVKKEIFAQTELGIEYRYFLSKPSFYEQSAGLSLTYNF